MAAVKKSRSCYTGALTRAMDKLKLLTFDDTASIKALDVDDIERIFCSVERTERNFLTLGEEAQDFAPEGEEEETFQEAEAELLETFEDNASKAKKLANHLITLKGIQTGLKDLTYDMSSLESTLTDLPEEDHTATLHKIELSFSTLRREWKKTNLHEEHPMKKELDACTKDINSLAATTASALHKANPSTTSSTPAEVSYHSIGRDSTKLPAIDLPTFKGDILQWPTFWQQFSASVDNRKDLPESTKLAYLRTAIKDPNSQLILNPSMDNPNTYKCLVKELHQRYRRIKKIHRELVAQLINIPAAKNNSTDLRNLVDATHNCVESLEATGHFTLESFITSLTYSKLPYKMQIDWDDDQDEDDKILPYSKLLEYVTKKTFHLADHKSFVPTTPSTPVPEKKPARRQDKPSHSRPQKSHVYSVSTPTSSPTPYKWECVLCKPEKHPLHICTKWLGFSVDQRLTQVKDRKLCANCLAGGHATGDCKSSYRCRDCRQNHHMTIHKDNTPSVQISSTLSQSQQLPDALLMTAEVLLKGPGGHQLKARAFLDPGAGLSLVSNRVAQILELPLESSRTSFTTVQGTKCQGSKYLTTLTISPLHNKRDFKCRPAVVQTVTEKIPNKLLAPVHDYPHLLGLHLADPTFNIPGRVDILLGADLWLQLQGSLPPITASASEPGAQDTVFGWVLAGPVKAQRLSTQHIPACHVQPMSNDELYNLAYDFWLAESTEQPDTPLSVVEAQVEKHYADTVTYSPTACRYQVTLPRRSDCQPLGVSRPQAVQRYFSNEASITRRGVHKDFQAQIQGYLDAGHAEPVPAAELSLPHFYLPMHSVVKQSSTSTKLRVVFDGSATSSSGVSLNHLLQVGPTLHPTLANILMKFRTYPVALTADVAKMYREVELLPTDRDLHRFVWRPTPQDSIQDFRMTRVTFGVSASPYLAIKTLQQTAKDHGAEHPTASAHICSSFYVDDLLAGAKTAEEAMDLFSTLRSILQRGGFNLCKWRSSDSDVLQSIPPDLQEKLLTKDATTLQPSAQPKALGLQWDSKQDCMCPSINIPTSYRKTKRGIISDVSKTFDVLGWISPAILPMKILYQTLWEKGQEWDGDAPDNVIEEHAKWREQLPCLSNKKLPRCYTSHSQPLQQELHGFSDASKKAYGAVVYLRTTYLNHSPTVSLVTAKTKVVKRNIPKKNKKTKKAEEEAKKNNPQPPTASPVKPKTKEEKEKEEKEKEEKEKEEEEKKLRLSTIPKLELNGAVLLTKLLNNVAAVLEIPLDHITAWTDSSIVLSWLDGRFRNFKQFTANRVSYIMEHTEPQTWKHVPGVDNPADCASRGMTPQELFQHSLWWQGPSWLHDDPVPIPDQPPRRTSPTLELRTVYTILLQAEFASQFELRSNNYHHIIAMTAWWFRFFTRLKEGRPSPDNRRKCLTPQEYQLAEHWLLKQSQHRSFPKEHLSLSKQKGTAPSSRLRALTPLMDQEGLIRVGGRLEHSTLSKSQQHPIIVDGKDSLIKKLFLTKHITLGHCGPSLLLCHTSNHLHVVGARRLSRDICSSCVTCRRVNPRPAPQMLGELPAERTKANQPAFTDTGMDFAGPFSIRQGHGRTPVDAHICIFICLATKAIHLEVTSDLSTKTFIACLRRFISRRNCPKTLHCDNGPNFVGARRELERLYSFLAEEDNDEAIRHFLLQHQIQWSHIPAASPHFGGLWESAVRSMKRHLRRLMGTLKLTYEELTTVTCQIEACLNSRPLLPMTCHNPDGITPLTAGHFLFLDAPNSYPTDPRLPEEPRLLKKWNQCQAVVQHFWARWSREYLNTLQTRTKWQKTKPNLKTGDIVIYKPKDNFACRWPIAKVVQTYPGEDGLVRVVLIQPTSGEVRKRPVTKLSLIYREDDQPQTTSTVASPGSMSRQGSPSPGQEGSTTHVAARLPTVVSSLPTAAATAGPPGTPVPGAQAVQQPHRRLQPPRACNQPRSYT